METREVFIAYFDILGFKNIVKNKSTKELHAFYEKIVIASQMALSKGKRIKSDFVTESIPDLQFQDINCLHVSDSIIFWTNSNTMDEFQKIFDVCKIFISYHPLIYPLLRGCLTCGDILFNPDFIKARNALFVQSSLYGKGLVKAYEIAESLQLSGCIVDYQLSTTIKNNITIKEGFDYLYQEISYKNVNKKDYIIVPFQITSERHRSNILKTYKDGYKFSSSEETWDDNIKMKLQNTENFIKSLNI